MAFKKAVRKQVKLKLALTGPAGAGKTYSALLVAKGLGGKVAVIDTENGSASLYADLFEFETDEIAPPFKAVKYINSIEEAEKLGVDTIIIDSLSHAWGGEGGILDQKSDLDANPKSNQWTNWKKPKAENRKLMNAILHSKCHVICCMRSKQSYEQIMQDGKKVIERLGLAPIAEPDVEFEFTIVFDMHNKMAIASKDRTSIFEGKTFQPTEETGRQILAWLNDAKPEEPKPFIPTQQHKIKLRTTAKDAGWTDDDILNALKDRYKKKFEELTEAEYQSLIFYFTLEKPKSDFEKEVGQLPPVAGSARDE